MTFSTYLSMLPLVLVLAIQIVSFGSAIAAPQDHGVNEFLPKRVPVLYEAYYPEPREWAPEASLQELKKLRELTNQLLREEEQLSKLTAMSAGPDNVFEPRNQILRYIFSRQRPSMVGSLVPVSSVVQPPAPIAPVDDDVQVTSLTVSDTGRSAAAPDGHRIRHHHGEADWMLRKLSANAPSS